jgi:hypothetical protein
MIDRDHRDGINAPRHILEAVDNLARGLRLQELHAGTHPETHRRSSRLRQRPGEILVEQLIRPLQQEAEPVVRQALLQPPPDQPRPVIAQLLRRIEHPLRRFLPHRQPRIEHPVDRGDAEAGQGGDIGDGGTTGHGNPARNDHPCDRMMMQMIETIMDALLRNCNRTRSQLRQFRRRTVAQETADDPPKHA